MLPGAPFLSCDTVTIFGLDTEGRLDFDNVYLEPLSVVRRLHLRNLSGRPLTLRLKATSAHPVNHIAFQLHNENVLEDGSTAPWSNELFNQVCHISTVTLPADDTCLTPLFVVFNPVPNDAKSEDISLSSWSYESTIDITAVDSADSIIDQIAIPCRANVCASEMAIEGTLASSGIRFDDTVVGYASSREFTLVNIADIALQFTTELIAVEHRLRRAGDDTNSTSNISASSSRAVAASPSSSSSLSSSSHTVNQSQIASSGMSSAMVQAGDESSNKPSGSSGTGGVSDSRGGGGSNSSGGRSRGSQDKPPSIHLIDDEQRDARLDTNGMTVYTVEPLGRLKLRLTTKAYNTGTWRWILRFDNQHPVTQYDDGKNASTMDIPVTVSAQPFARPDRLLVMTDTGETASSAGVNFGDCVAGQWKRRAIVLRNVSKSWLWVRFRHTAANGDVIFEMKTEADNTRHSPPTSAAIRPSWNTRDGSPSSANTSGQDESAFGHLLTGDDTVPDTDGDDVNSLTGGDNDNTSDLLDELAVSDVENDDVNNSSIDNNNGGSGNKIDANSSTLFSGADRLNQSQPDQSNNASHPNLDSISVDGINSLTPLSSRPGSTSARSSSSKPVSRRAQENAMRQQQQQHQQHQQNVTRPLQHRSGVHQHSHQQQQQQQQQQRHRHQPLDEIGHLKRMRGRTERDPSSAQSASAAVHIEELFLRPANERTIYVCYKPSIKSDCIKFMDEYFTVNILCNAVIESTRTLASGEDIASPGHTSIGCVLRSCTSVINVDPPSSKPLDFGVCDLGTRKSRSFTIRNISECEARVQVNAISKILHIAQLYRDVIILPPHGHVSVKIEMFPRKTNDSYRKQVNVRNLLNANNTGLIEIRAVLRDRKGMGVHTQAYRVMAHIAPADLKQLHSQLTSSSNNILSTAAHLYSDSVHTSPTIPQIVDTNSNTYNNNDSGMGYKHIPEGKNFADFGSLCFGQRSLRIVSLLNRTSGSIDLDITSSHPGAISLYGITLFGSLPSPSPSTSATVAPSTAVIATTAENDALDAIESPIQLLSSFVPSPSIDTIPAATVASLGHVIANEVDSVPTSSISELGLQPSLTNTLPLGSVPAKPVDADRASGPQSESTLAPAQILAERLRTIKAKIRHERDREAFLESVGDWDQSMYNISTPNSILWNNSNINNINNINNSISQRQSQTAVISAKSPPTNAITTATSATTATTTTTAMSQYAQLSSRSSNIDSQLVQSDASITATQKTLAAKALPSLPEYRTTVDKSRIAAVSTALLSSTTGNSGGRLPSQIVTEYLALEYPGGDPVSRMQARKKARSVVVTRRVVRRRKSAGIDQNKAQQQQHHHPHHPHQSKSRMDSNERTPAEYDKVMSFGLGIDGAPEQIGESKMDKPQRTVDMSTSISSITSSSSDSKSKPASGTNDYYMDKLLRMLHQIQTQMTELPPASFSSSASEERFVKNQATLQRNLDTMISNGFLTPTSQFTLEPAGLTHVVVVLQPSMMSPTSTDTEQPVNINKRIALTKSATVTTGGASGGTPSSTAAALITSAPPSAALLPKDLDDAQPGIKRRFEGRLFFRITNASESAASIIQRAHADSCSFIGGGDDDNNNNTGSQHTAADHSNCKIDAILSGLAPREFLIQASLCHPAIELNQRSINFGLIQQLETRRSILIVRNKSEMPLLYSLRKTGHISSGDIEFFVTSKRGSNDASKDKSLGAGADVSSGYAVGGGANADIDGGVSASHGGSGGSGERNAAGELLVPARRQGVIRSYGKREFVLQLRPRLAGTFQESVWIENMSDHRASQPVYVKAVVRKPTNFFIESLVVDFGTVSIPTISLDHAESLPAILSRGYISLTNTTNKSRLFEIRLDEDADKPHLIKNGQLEISGLIDTDMSVVTWIPAPEGAGGEQSTGAVDGSGHGGAMSTKLGAASGANRSRKEKKKSKGDGDGDDGKEALSIEEQIEEIEQKVKIAIRKGNDEKAKKLQSKLDSLRQDLISRSSSALAQRNRQPSPHNPTIDSVPVSRVPSTSASVEDAAMSTTVVPPTLPVSNVSLTADATPGSSAAGSVVKREQRYLRLSLNPHCSAIVTVVLMCQQRSTSSESDEAQEQVSDSTLSGRYLVNEYKNRDQHKIVAWNATVSN